MKTFKLILVFVLFSVVVLSCKYETEPETKTVDVEETKIVKEIDANATIGKAEFTIEGMTCAIGCAKMIEKKLADMEGVKSAIVDYDKKIAMVEYDEAKVTTTLLEETVTNASEKYSVNGMKTVESFSTNFAKKDGKKKCSKDCKKACCVDKA
ncbi:MAG: heavy-metal-associated domain-containing protein [Bacteroidetes bacterium]|nr:heavy-metal-associated domain-containing protein [Bacteroidota bacterium]